MMDEAVRLIFVATITFGLAVVLTAILIRQLNKNNVMDIPNDRSSHVNPTPRGGGVGIIISILVGWLLDRALTDALNINEVIILAASVVLAFVCFIDDLRGMSASLKLIFQIICILPGLLFLFETGGLFREWMAPEFDIVVTGIIWLWFINLFNFMDGIDGITGSQVMMIGFGIAVFSATGIITEQVLGPSIVFLAAALGFLVWNWSPAIVFLGDVGSIPLGYLIGWSLISIQTETTMPLNSLIIIAILPGYYLADASITLGVRILKGNNPIEAHKDHFYQKAWQNGASHASICQKILLANSLSLIIAFVLVGSHPIIALIFSGIITSILLSWMLIKKIDNPYRN